MTDALARRRLARVRDAVNVQVDLVQLLNHLGHDDIRHPGAGRSVKLHCPWGHMHSDLGQEKSFRVYDTNTGFCFAGCGYINPVRVAAKHLDSGLDEAAQWLAARYQVATGDLDSAVAQMELQMRPDPAALVDALRIWVDSIYPDNHGALVAMVRCARVVSLARTADDADQWLTKSKKLIAEYVGDSDED